MRIARINNSLIQYIRWMIMFNNKMASYETSVQKLNRLTSQISQFQQKDFKVTFSYMSPSSSIEKTQKVKTLNFQQSTPQKNRHFFDEYEFEQQKNLLDAKSISTHFYLQRLEETHNILLKKYEQIQSFYKPQKILVKLKLTKNEHEDQGCQRSKKISINLTNSKNEKQRKPLAQQNFNSKNQSKNNRSITRAIIHLHPNTRIHSNSPQIKMLSGENQSIKCLKSWNKYDVPTNNKMLTQCNQTPAHVYQTHSKKGLTLFSHHNSPTDRKINCKVLFSPRVRKRIEQKSKENSILGAIKNPLQRIKQKTKKNHEKRINENRKKKKIVSKQKLDKKYPIRTVKTLGD